MLDRIRLPEGVRMAAAQEEDAASALAGGPGWAVLRSATGDGFSMALSLPLCVPMHEALCLPHLAALCVCEALGSGAVVHWPSDILADGKTLGAVRCRAKDGAVAPEFTMRPAGRDMTTLAEDILDRWWDLAAGFPANREARLQDYCNRCATLKKGVDFLYRGVPMNGYAFAVNSSADLMVMTKSRTLLTLRTGPVKIACPRDDLESEMPNPCRV